ncbi:hypothetical protein RQP46_007333 [Phenoliferia psychrophenolica]
MPRRWRRRRVGLVFPKQYHITDLGSPEDEDTAIERIADYPLVAFVLSKSYAVIASNRLSLALFKTLDWTSIQLLDLIEPRLSYDLDRYNDELLLRLDDYEDDIPELKEMKPEHFVKRLKELAEEGVRRGDPVVDNFAQLVSPYTDMLSARISPVVAVLLRLQDLASGVIAAAPRDLASLQDALHTITTVLWILMLTVIDIAQDLPTHAHQATNVFLDSVKHVLSELADPDLPLSDKAANVLVYSQAQLSPFLLYVIQRSQNPEDASP